MSVLLNYVNFFTNFDFLIQNVNCKFKKLRMYSWVSII